MSKTFDEFQKEVNIDLNKIYTADEAHEFINKNTVACYRGKMSFTEPSPKTGTEIIQKLVDISAWFDKAFDEAWNKEFPDDPR